MALTSSLEDANYLHILSCPRPAEPPGDTVSAARRLRGPPCAQPGESRPGMIAAQPLGGILGVPLGEAASVRADSVSSWTSNARRLYYRRLVTRGQGTATTSGLGWAWCLQQGATSLIN